MKTIKVAIATFAILATTAVVQAAQTTTTTESYTYSKDGGVTSDDGAQKCVKQSVRRTDKEILTDLDGKIDGFKVLDEKISFTVVDGVVTLRGRADNTSEKDHAKLLAESIPGVVRVDNQINVK